MQELFILRAALATYQPGSEPYAIIRAGIARIVAEMDAEQPATHPCAWCLREQGLPMGNGSHGICPRHSESLRAQSRARRAARMAVA